MFFIPEKEKKNILFTSAHNTLIFKVSFIYLEGKASLEALQIMFII